MAPLVKENKPDGMIEDRETRRRVQMRSPWAWSPSTLVTMLLGFGAFLLMVQSFLARQLDTKGCEMCYMRPAYMKIDDFGTEHTRLAGKYSMYIYREGGIDHDIRVKGVPVLFIPGNSGSSKQVRSLASESAYYYHNVISREPNAHHAGKRPLDFFTVDFNEDFTAFHGQTLLDQAEYLNDAIAYILSLYHTPGRALRDSDLPDPTSVIVVGHSMGGVVARTMFTLPNYQVNSINTIITLAAPHAVPAISFDGEIVRTYKSINDHWRHAYSQKPDVDNPLRDVTVISIAGGGLDTIVPSDYASLSSLVPETHGFTVFSSSIPNVWTGMDHLAITWCDQMRKSVVGALYDVINARKPAQTLTPPERMRAFKKWFLTGLEDIVEKNLPLVEAEIVFTVNENNAVFTGAERLALHALGISEQKPQIYLLPVPSQGIPGGRRFTLLTNEKIGTPGEVGNLDVLFCSVIPLQAKESSATFSASNDTSEDGPESTRLACKNSASDSIALPSSTRHSTFPFKTDQHPFSYLQYDLEELSAYHFVAIVDKSKEESSGWVYAEFSPASASLYHVDLSLQRLLTSGLKIKLPANRPLITDIKIPALHSSLLAYQVHINGQTCVTDELFAPLLRQYITEVYESKFFVNVKDANINLHGVAPYLPPPVLSNQSLNGLSFQLWMDPMCNNRAEFSLQVDVLGSLGKLWMRYRIVFAAFPILIMALVLRHQFQVYDETAVFMSFAEGLNECLRGSIPFTLTTLTSLSLLLAGARRQSRITTGQSPLGIATGNSSSLFRFADNELLLGSDDVFFWFLVPLFGLMCVAICVTVNYIMLALTYLFMMIFSVFSLALRTTEARTRTKSVVTPTQRRIITTVILLSLVSTIVPYHFAYVVLLLVHLATCVRGCRLARESGQGIDYNFYNYAHSILILMMWVLPINLPVLVVWMRNLALGWLTPFSSHHNILSIVPFALLVETVSTGRMIPRVHSGFALVTNTFLFSFAAYAAMYGVTYAYVLHHLANVLCAWLVWLHFDIYTWVVQRVDKLRETMGPDVKAKK